MCGAQAITAPKPNFLRVNAQMYNLDKQKTVPRRKTLPATSRQKNQTLTLDTKLQFDLTKLARPVCEIQTVLSA